MSYTTFTASSQHPGLAFPKFLGWQGHTLEQSSVRHPQIQSPLNFRVVWTLLDGQDAAHLPTLAL